MKSILCPYCGGEAKFEPSSAHRYHGRDYGPIYECKPCDAFVGTHKRRDPAYGDPTAPLGTPANKPLREARKAAHAAFDPIWKDRCTGRRHAYAMLAEFLCIAVEGCHIGMFDVSQCEKTVEFASHYFARRQREAGAA